MVFFVNFLFEPGFDGFFGGGLRFGDRDFGERLFLGEVREAELKGLNTFTFFPLCFEVLCFEVFWSVVIDIDGKMKNFLRFPGFETYVPPEKDEEHIEEVLTTTELQKLEKKEIKYQERKKKRKKKKKIKEKRKRAKKRTENI